MSDSVTWRNFITEEDIRRLPNVRSLVSIALQSQYSQSEKYRQLGELFNDEIDASSQVDDLYTNVLNPETANGEFLDWWGKRIGVDRSIVIDGVNTYLDDEFFRFLIFYRAIANISDSTVSTMNKLFLRLTGYKARILDMQDMTIRLLIFGEVGSAMRAIIKNYGLLNRPAGVLAKIRITSPNQIMLGFHGSELEPFNVGTFNPETDIIVD